MNISKRLKTIGNLVDDNSFLIDVGCDHALLDIYVVKSNPTIRAIAADINKGPLEQAKKNIKVAKLESKIEVLLADGIESVPDYVDTLVMSGMGGKNMLGIVKYQMKILKQFETIIISPNNDCDVIRTFLCKNGFYLVEELMVKDSNFFYQILKFKKGKKKYSTKELFFGPILLTEKSASFVEFLKKELVKKEQIFALLPSNYISKRRSLKKEIKFISNYLSN